MEIRTCAEPRRPHYPQIALDLVGKNRERIPVLLSSVRKDAPDGTPLYVRTTLFNASDRRKYERELLTARRKAEQAAKAKADFLAMVTHEIRNPLHCIMAVNELFRTMNPTPQHEQYLRILKTASESLLNLVNDVLDFSKVEAGKVALDERRFNVHELVFGVVCGLNARAQEKGLLLKVRVDERVPPLLRGDPIKIGQVLTNLAGNVLKFTHQGTVTVTLALEALGVEGATLRFSVKDTGIGIGTDRLAAIFDDYAQATASTAGQYGGTGLGLAISRRLLELYGSKMEVQSELGRGSEFSFNLQLPIATAPPTSANDELKGPQSLQGLRVLVAEQEEVEAYALGQLLSGWGVEFELVRTAHEAARRVQQSSF